MEKRLAMITDFLTLVKLGFRSLPLLLLCSATLSLSIPNLLFLFLLFLSLKLSLFFSLLSFPRFSLKILERKSKNGSLRVKILFILERVLEIISLVFISLSWPNFYTLFLLIISNSKLKQLLSPMFYPSPQSFSPSNPTVVIHLEETFYFSRHSSLSCILQAT